MKEYDDSEDEFLTKLSREIAEMMGQKSAIEITKEILSKYAVILKRPLAQDVPLPFDPDDYPLV